MTHSVNQNVEAALASFRTAGRWFSPKEINENQGPVPRYAGLYGWWFRAPPPKVDMDGTIQRDGFSLLYVGIAPQRPAANGRTSKRTLHQRLRNHCRGPIATSTFRRSLAFLLAEDLGFQIIKGADGKVRIGREAEARLTDWIDQNARVSWVIHPEPWLLEDALISNGPRLPLNIRGSIDPFSRELRRIRAMA